MARIGASVRQQGNQQNTIKAKSELERLKQAAISVQMSEGLSTKQKQENLARFRVEAQKIIDSNSTALCFVVGGWIDFKDCLV